MNEISIESYQVKNLPSRYGIQKTQTYERLKTLGIAPHKEGRLSVITGEELKLMDELHQHLEKGGKLNEYKNEEAEYYQPQGLEVGSAERSPSITPSVESNELMERLITALVLSINPPSSPVNVHRELQEVYDQGWLLSSRQIQELIGAKPTGDRYTWGNWIFIRTDLKFGRQRAWKVDVIDTRELRLTGTNGSTTEAEVPAN